MTTVSAFDVHVVLPLSTRTRSVVHDESEAVALAREWVGPNQCQVTITAWTPDYGRTFAVRHFTWKNGAADSGWRIWEDAKFIGGGELPWPVEAGA